jgi:glycosyltransferase involved in cell wall biosynthesis
MRVNFDSQIFCSQAVGGISRYFASLAAEMDSFQDVQPRIVAPYHVNGYLQTLPRDVVRGHQVPQSRAPKALLRIASLVAGGLMQGMMPADILHRTYYYPFCHLPSRAKNVLTVYDMIHEKFPQHFPARDPIARWKKLAVAAADAIICISEQTRQDLLYFNPQIPPEKVSVTYLGFDDLGQLLTDESAQAFRTRALGINIPYILFVGSRVGYKNFEGLLQAYQASPWLRENFGLLCFGGGAFTKAEQALISRGGSAARVQQIGGNDAVLAACYRHAALFVYPSLYEGFGIPPLEAMSLDCPVACSQTSSIPEVVGDAAALFDPTNIQAMQATLETLLNSPDSAAVLVERGRIRRTQFSWHQCAEETVGIYRRTLAQ